MAEGTVNKPPDEQSELEKFVATLLRHQVEFLVIGGQAEILMGSPRVTYDTDLCYRRDQKNLERLSAALLEFQPTLRGVPPDLPWVLDARALAFGNNYTLETSIGPLDLLGWVEPLGGYDALLEKSEVYSVGNVTVRTIGLEDLIRVKEHIGRAKDRESLLQLLAIRRLRSEQPPSA